MGLAAGCTLYSSTGGCPVIPALLWGMGGQLRLLVCAVTPTLADSLGRDGWEVTVEFASSWQLLPTSFVHIIIIVHSSRDQYWLPTLIRRMLHGHCIIFHIDVVTHY